MTFSHRTSRLVRAALALALFSVAVFGPYSATAQETQPERDTVEPTDRQVELNEEAVRLIASGDAVKAITLLQESNYIGELNVAYLNLGRAYQSIGRCREARTALEKVSGMPAVQSPPPGLVNSRAKSFLSQLDEECDDGEKQASLSKADPLVPGEDIDEEASGDTTTRGWVTAGVGLGLGLAAGGLHVMARAQRNQVREPTTNSAGQVTNITQVEADGLEDSANTLDTVALSAGITAAVVTGLGVYWLVSSPDSDHTVTVAPGVTHTGASLHLRLRL